MDKAYEIVRSYEGELVENESETVREIFSEGNVGISEARIEEADLHYHEETSEIYYVLEGEGNLEVEGKDIHLEQDDLVKINPGNLHRAYSEEEFRVLVISTPPWKEEDHHKVEN